MPITMIDEVEDEELIHGEAFKTDAVMIYDSIASTSKMYVLRIISIEIQIVQKRSERFTKRLRRTTHLECKTETDGGGAVR